MSLSRRAALLLPLATPAFAEETLDGVMRALAAIRTRQDRFTEEKVIPELELPLPNEGTLAWTAPDRLEKRTTWPIDEVLSVAGGNLTYERRDRGIRRDFALADQPEMQALVEAIRGTLAGDLAALRRHYDVGFRNTETGWSLILTPLSLRVRGAVQRIVVTGSGTAVRGVDTDGGGGVTRMRITPGP